MKTEKELREKLEECKKVRLEDMECKYVLLD